MEEQEININIVFDNISNVISISMNEPEEFEYPEGYIGNNGDYHDMFE